MKHGLFLPQMDTDETQMLVLNQRFGAAGRIAFRAGEGGLPVAVLVNKYAACEVSLYGGHVLDYRPVGLGPVLFLSKRSAFEPGKPIRGGIPVCWPWFGPGKGISNTQHGMSNVQGGHPIPNTECPMSKETCPRSASHLNIGHSVLDIGYSLPLHGFARIMPWELSATEYTGDATEIRLALADSEHTRPFWDFAFGLTLRIRLEQHLTLELVTENRDTRPFDFTQGFHPYFRVSDISAVSVHGLDGAAFTDHPSDEPQHQHGALFIQRETNRIYTPQKNEIAIHDAKLKRATLVTFSGTRNAVVWNPWLKAFPDLAPDDYAKMLCVEPVNRGDTSITLEPGERHTLSMNIQAKLI